MLIKKFRTINSTNTYALEHFEELDDLCVVVADIQTQGRGRFDRTWFSYESENIYLSFVLKPMNNRYLSNLTQYLSVVSANVIESYGVKTQIKWPNDVLISGKKICGILCESKLKSNKIQGVVLGIGINLNMSKESVMAIGRPATSLNLELGKTVDNQAFLDKLMFEFEKHYTQVLENGFSSFKEDYIERVGFLGQKIFIQQRDGAEKEEFTALRLDENGNLVVMTAENVEKTIYSGDLIL